MNKRLKTLKIVEEIGKLLMLTSNEESLHFWISFALRTEIMPLEKDTQGMRIACATFYNNKPILRINPELFFSLSAKGKLRVLQHEISHLLRGDPFKIRNYSKAFLPQTINILADAFINDGILGKIEANSIDELEREFSKFFKEKVKSVTVARILPAISSLTEPPVSSKERFLSLTLEEILGRIKCKKHLLIKPLFDDYGILEDIKEPRHSDERSSILEVRRIVEEIKKSIGFIPGNLKDIIKEWIYTEIKVPIQGLYAYLERLEYSWDWPKHYRINGKDVYLPRFTKFYKPGVLFILDTSASISEEEAKMFFGSMIKISKIAKVFYLEIDVEPRTKIIEFSGKPKGLLFKGRGGTSFASLDKIAKEINKFDVIVFLSDGCVEEFPRKIRKRVWFYTTKVIPQNLPSKWKAVKLVKKEYRILN